MRYIILLMLIGVAAASALSVPVEEEEDDMADLGLLLDDVVTDTALEFNREGRARQGNDDGHVGKTASPSPSERIAKYNTFFDMFYRRLNSKFRSNQDPFTVGLARTGKRMTDSNKKGKSGKSGKSGKKGGKGKTGKNNKQKNGKGKKSSGKKGKRNPKHLDDGSLDHNDDDDNDAVNDDDDHVINKRDVDDDIDDDDDAIEFVDDDDNDDDDDEHDIQKRDVQQLDDGDDDDDDDDDDSVSRTGKQLEDEAGEDVGRKGRPSKKGSKGKAAKKSSKKGGRKGGSNKKGAKKGDSKKKSKKSNKGKSDKSKKDGKKDTRSALDRTSRATILGVGSMARVGEVVMLPRKDFTEIESAFQTGMISLRVSRSLGSGKDKEVRNARATTPKMQGVMKIAFTKNGKAKVTKVSFMPAVEVSVEGSLGKGRTDKTSKLMQRSINMVSPLIAKRIQFTARDLLKESKAPKAGT